MALLASNEIQPAGSSRSKEASKGPPKRRTKRRKKSSMQSRLDAASALSDDFPVFDLEMGEE